jgi:hypothetical protein
MCPDEHLIQPSLDPADHLVVERHRSMAGVHQLVEVNRWSSAMPGSPSRYALDFTVGHGG